LSLRLRLTVLCVALVGCVLAAFSVTTYFITSARIYASLDDSLSSEANAILATLPPGELSPVLIDGVRPALNTEGASGSLFQIRDASGNVLYSSFRGSPDLLPQNRDASREAFFQGKVANQELRILHLPLTSGTHTGGTIEVARSFQETDEALTELLIALVSGSVIALVLTLIPAYYIAGSALKPLRGVSQLAQRIERTSDFSQRLAPRDTRDEIGELTTTFNELIQRIEHTLAAHSQFLAESSHELRRPLTILRTNLDILRDPTLPEADRAACLERMSREARAMSSLVGDLLLLNRDKTQSLEHVPVALSHVCTDEVSRLQFAEPSARVIAEVAPNVVVDGDEQRLHQMVKNLLENAVNYSPRGGRVTLRLSESDGQAQLVVQDSGPGIAKEDRPHIFDRFYRGASAREMRSDGVGLGLAIVKYVVDGHGGTITVESAPEGGASFVVRLPVSHETLTHLTELLAVP
jgi:two-component system sensor histidine kinase MprB